MIRTPTRLLLASLSILMSTGAWADFTATPSEARAIAKEAYLYGFPVVEMYKTLYTQAVDKTGPNYKAPFNHIGNTAQLFTPKDTAFVTPNSDTPYSFVWLDLRAEPVVLTLPKIEDNRYYSVQLIDLYTQNFGYLGTRSTGNNGGHYMIAGPNWKGQQPPMSTAWCTAKATSPTRCTAHSCSMTRTWARSSRFKAATRSRPSATT